MTTLFCRGDIFGELELVESFRKNNRIWWLCKCSCGAEVRTDTTRLKKGTSTQCIGCGNIASGLKRRNDNHEHQGEKEYRAWSNLKNRCNNPNYHLFHRYGGRGITYCKEWESFQDFLKDMGRAPTKIHSIDRIDNDRGYSKENCKWSTPVEQSNNMSTNRVYEYKGEVNTLTGWCRDLSLNFDMVRGRLDSGKYTIEQALELPSGAGNHKFRYTTPKGEFKSILEAAKANSKSPKTLRKLFSDQNNSEWRKISAY